MKKAVITGITGQDGSYMAQHLLSKNYTVYGAVRNLEIINTKNLEFLEIPLQKIKFIEVDFNKSETFLNELEKIYPDEIYNFAAISSHDLCWSAPELTFKVNTLFVIKLLNLLKEKCPYTRLFQSSSSAIFQESHESFYNENSKMLPSTPYGVAKLAVHQLINIYRSTYGIKACSGILFNHESPIRGENFVTRKIVSSLVKIKSGEQEFLELGNLDTARDWGFAKEFVECMATMLEQPEQEDFVIATGELTSLRQFINAAIHEIDMDITWKGHGVEEIGIETITGKTIVKINKDFFRPLDVTPMRGDITKARTKLKWTPKIKGQEIAKLMIREELKRHAINFDTKNKVW